MSYLRSIQGLEPLYRFGYAVRGTAPVVVGAHSTLFELYALNKPFIRFGWLVHGTAGGTVPTVTHAYQITPHMSFRTFAGIYGG